MSGLIVPTGNIIKEYLDERNISQIDLSRRIGASERHLSKMLNGKTRLSEEMAIKLEKVMPDIPASYWLNYEAKYQEYLAREKERSNLDSLDLKQISKRFHFSEVFKGSGLPLVDQAIEMLKFLGISDFDNFRAALPRCSTEFMQDGGEAEAVVIWLKLCESHIEDQNSDLSDISYQKKNLENCLGTLKAISSNTDLSSSLKSCAKLLNSVGVFFVHEPPIANAKVRGALSTHDNHPAVYISGRFKTHDHVWFTILHEIAHLIMHYNPKTPDIFMEELASDSEKDREANEYARSFFVNPEAYKAFVDKGEFAEGDVRRFAVSQGVSPDIVVGFLQHDSYIAQSQLNHLKTKM